jgi:hypothetical protein
MRAMTDADVDAIRSAFNSVLAALPENRLRNLVLELLFSPFTTTTQHRKIGRPRKGDVEGENVVPLQRNGRRRRKGAVDETKLAARRQRAAASRRAKRHAAKAIEATKPAAAAGNGTDAPVTAQAQAQAFWQRCEQIEPGAPWHIPVQKFGIREAVAQQAFRARTLPPRIGAMALNKFLEVRT